MGKVLNPDEFAAAILGFEHTAFRLELQPRYSEPDESETLAKFFAGDPEPPNEIGAFRSWFARIGTLVREGKRIGRVRIHEDPPTPYQRWERWAGGWNVEAGEIIRYLTRARAHEIGLLPAAGNVDWWLLDSNRLVRMWFDEAGNRIRNELETDPALVVQACAWRDLAVHYAVPDSIVPHADA